MTLRITAGELERLTGKDPDWVAKHATAENPVIVSDYCRLVDSPIRSLSPYILFEGVDRDGNAAGFEHCPNLKIAQGIFNGHVDFHNSGIEEIDPKHLVILKPNHKGFAADFSECPKLAIARGTFPGWVEFIKSGVREIDTDPETGLNITHYDKGGRAASFSYCRNLKVAQGKFPGFVNFEYSGVHTIRNLEIAKKSKEGKYLGAYSAEFRGCDNLVHCPQAILESLRFTFSDRAKQQIKEQHEKETRARGALKQPDFEL